MILRGGIRLGEMEVLASNFEIWPEVTKDQKGYSRLITMGLNGVEAVCMAVIRHWVEGRDLRPHWQNGFRT